jgi:protein O-GlcNAc transferase
MKRVISIACCPPHLPIARNERRALSKTRIIAAQMPEAPMQIALRLYQSGRSAEARELCRQILSENPDNAAALSFLGSLEAQTRNLDTAITLVRRAIALNPGDAFAYYNLANILSEFGQLHDAIAPYRQALALQPDLVDAHINLGNVFRRLRDYPRAIDSYREAVRRNPANPAACNNLGSALLYAGNLDEAITFLGRAIELKPDLAEAHNNLGNALKRRLQIDDALAAYRQAIRVAPGFATAHYNLGITLLQTGFLDEAIASYRQAASLDPRDPTIHSNLIMTLHYHADSAPALAEELRQWNERRAKPLEKLIKPHANSRKPDRRLRIGYVSPDFRDHVVARVMLPILRCHDRAQTEIYCYSNVSKPDADTEIIRRHADVWRDISRLGDSQAADLIRKDQIDILVDLALHTGGNRLLVFAQKPAPVQACYLAYCGSTGQPTVDYRFSDPYLDPPDSDTSVYAEQTIRLPQTYWCYQPSAPAPDPAPPPVLTTGHITFGCLCNFAKVLPALDTWARILQGVENSRLILHAPPGAHLDAVRQRFSTHGVVPDRLEFLPRMAWQQYIQIYHRIDIGLDPFPWNGGITTLDALWMGVAVVTLAGQTALERGGVSILSNLELTELIASTTERYVEIAIGLANDPGRLSQLRSTLRPRMSSSCLMDANRFTRDLEAAYRQMWRDWCKR